MISAIKYLILTGFLFQSFIYSYGQNTAVVNPFQENVFTSLSVKDGLSQSTVFSILKDSQGFMWFGTRTGGLNKYNGYEFLVYQNNPLDSNSLASNTVISLFEDHAGTIWIGTRNGGLNNYVPSQDKFNRLSLPDYDKNMFNTTAFHQTSDDGIWIGTSEGLFYHSFELETLELILPAEEAGTISTLTSFRDSFLLIGATEKILLFNTLTKEIVSQYRFDENNVATAATDRITPIHVDLKENIWVGSVDGLFQYSINNNYQFEKITPFENVPAALNTYIRSIKTDNRGDLWFATISGLVKYSIVNKAFSLFTHDETNPLSLSHNSVYSLLIDENQTLWAGTWGGGVNMMSGLLRKFEHYSHQTNNPKSLINNIVSSFAEDKNGLWVGTEQGGLNFYNKETNTFTHYPANNIGPDPRASFHIKSLLIDHEKTLWIGTFGNGLLRFNKDSNTFDHFLGNNKIFAMAQTSDKYIWIGSANGLFRINVQGQIIEHYRLQTHDINSISSNMITALLIDKSGDLWIGTNNGGINLYNRQANNFRRFSHNPDLNATLSSDYILSMCEGDEQILWVGTLQGLNKFNKLNGEVNRINEKVNFPDHVINGILMDENLNLWLSTNKGIINYLPQDETYTMYDYRDGLQSNEFNRGAYFKASDNKLYFGGINGFNSFFPSQIQTNTYIPGIQFTDLKLFYKSVKPGEPSSPLSSSVSHTQKIELNHNQSAFTLEYVALNYILSEKNQYAYYLEGYDTDWNYVGNKRSASYMNLKPGNYTFRVRASNNDKIWNNEGIKLEISILPPFWRTGWAFAILTFILFTLLLVARAIMISRIKQQNLLDYQRKEVKRMEEINNMKLRFFTDISHEFKTPLTLIASPIEKLKKFNSTNSEFNYLTNIASKNINRALRLVEQLMTFRRIEKDTIKVSVSENDMELFLREITHDFSELAAHKQIKMKFHSNLSTSGLQWFDRNFLDKIVFNLLSNAFKYTNKGGVISVFLNIENGIASITVNDTGIGIEQENLDHIFERFFTSDNPDQKITSGTGIGLSLVKNLVELHHGNINVESEPGSGSTFKVSIPVNKESYRNDEIAENKIKLDTSKIQPTEWKKENPTIPESKDPKSKENIILIVEDNEDMREYLAFNFTEYQTICVENGTEAIAAIKKIIPDVVISDLMMPKMNGIELLQNIRENHVTSHIPFVLLSAKSDINDKISGIETGADIYIEKPFDTEYLKAIIKNILLQRKKLKALFKQNISFDSENNEIPEHHRRFLKKASEKVLANIGSESFLVNELGAELGLSRSQLFRKFKTICDITPAEFIRNEKLKYAAELLLKGELNVNEIAYQTGFSSASYFITCFKKKYGKTPHEVAKQS